MTANQSSAAAYVRVAPGARYFQTETGEPFLLIGHNDALPWPNLSLLRCAATPDAAAAVDAHLRMLAAHGVTVLRVMLEDNADAQHDWLWEDPVGYPLAGAVQIWDDLIALCERHGLRLFVSFWDTFHLCQHWDRHPYGRVGSGFDGPASFCTSPTARAAQRERIRFFVDRWGGSPAIFAYDLFNEINAYWGGTPDDQAQWVGEMADFVRERERVRWGKCHLLTASLFGGTPGDAYARSILCHPKLDFASTHVYASGRIDNPANTIDCALAMRDAVRYAFENMPCARPYTDSEHGPIHLFLDLKRQMSVALDNRYYHNMSWAHLATGGAGGAMRWPFRDPHVLTRGMHDTQRAMARFLSALDWLTFAPHPIDHRLQVIAWPDSADAPATIAIPVVPFGCADGRQALIWLLRDLRRVRAKVTLPPAQLLLPAGALSPGNYSTTFWDTAQGEPTGTYDMAIKEGSTILIPLPPLGPDLALTIRPVV